MKIRKERFGSVEGMEITLYTLVNDNGVEVSVMNYGATVTSVLLPVGNGNKRNIVCGFDTLEGYFWHYKIFCVNGKYGIQNRVPYFLFYTFTK